MILIYHDFVSLNDELIIFHKIKHIWSFLYSFELLKLDHK